MTSPLPIAPIRRTIASLLLAILIGLPAFLPAEEPKVEQPGQLTLERIIEKGDFNAKSWGAARWTPEGSDYWLLDDSDDPAGGKELVRCNPVADTREVVVPAAALIPPGQTRPLAIADYALSADGAKLLIFTNTQKVWRQNTRGDYWVYDLERQTLRQLGETFKPASLMFAKFDPAGNRAAFVCRNNIFVQELDSYRMTQLTDDGSSTIINGTSDWVNEEELLIRDGFRWSPDGRAIAYWRFETEGVKKFTLVNYTGALYPTLKRFEYPKAGQQNSAVRVGVVSAAGGPTRWLALPGDPRQHYIPSIAWRPQPGLLIVQQLNRLQNANRFFRCPVTVDGDDTLTVSQPVEFYGDTDAAWVETGRDPVWLDRCDEFLTPSERDGWTHWYRVNCLTGATQLVTPGDYDAIDLVSVDEKRECIYLIASPGNPAQRYLYRVPLAGGRPKRITPARPAGTHGYRISADGRLAFHTWSAFGQPPRTDLVRLPGHKRIAMLENNRELRKKLKELGPANQDFFRVEADGVAFDGWCIKPPDFDPDQRYPLLMHVYGEPAGQTVLDQWGGANYLWHRLLAQQGYVVASIDNRGTPAPRGRDWRKCVYRQVGILAPADQAAATRQFIAQNPWLDPERVGIWGWSGGGSMTLHALFQYPELYRVGMAVAFVADMRFYDTIYQERYMGLPQDNDAGYTAGAPITHAGKLAGDLLLVYGTGDDNTHYQNCETLVNKLVEHNKYFTQMTYPNRTHGIHEGANTRFHLYSTLTRYLTTHLPPGPQP